MDPKDKQEEKLNWIYSLCGMQKSLYKVFQEFKVYLGMFHFL